MENAFELYEIVGGKKNALVRSFPKLLRAYLQASWENTRGAKTGS